MQTKILYFVSKGINKKLKEDSQPHFAWDCYINVDYLLEFMPKRFTAQTLSLFDFKESDHFELGPKNGFKRTMLEQKQALIIFRSGMSKGKATNQNFCLKEVEETFWSNFLIVDNNRHLHLEAIPIVSDSHLKFYWTQDKTKKFQLDGFSSEDKYLWIQSM